MKPEQHSSVSNVWTRSLLSFCKTFAAFTYRRPAVLFCTLRGQESPAVAQRHFATGHKINEDQWRGQCRKAHGRLLRICRFVASTVLDLNPPSLIVAADMLLIVAPGTGASLIIATTASIASTMDTGPRQTSQCFCSDFFSEFFRWTRNQRCVKKFVSSSSA